MGAEAQLSTFHDRSKNAAGAIGKGPQSPGAAVPGALPHAANPQQLQSWLRNIFESPKYQPPVLPRVAMQLTSLSRQQSVSFDEMVRVLEKDPLLTANILKVARSPLYGRRPPQSIKEALQRLGVARLRDVVWQVVTGVRMFRAGGITNFMERLQAHNIFVAHASRAIAARAGVVSEEAFVCGLLHDVGIGATVGALADTGAPMPPLTTLLDAMDGMHEDVGGLIATLWQLSPDITLVIKEHHRYDPHTRPSSAMMAVVCIADRLATEVGRGIVDSAGISHAERLFDQQTNAQYEQAMRHLNLSNKAAELTRELKELADKLSSGG